MGKVRRERHKYHISATTKKPTIITSAESSPKPQQSIIVPDNPFAGIDISFEALNQTLKDSDARSVISIKSTTRAPTVAKKEKRKLKHDTFLKSKIYMQEISVLLLFINKKFTN